MAATFDSSLRDSPSPPKLIFVFCRKTVPAGLILSEVFIAAALRLAFLRSSLASSTRPCSSHRSANRSTRSKRSRTSAMASPSRRRCSTYPHP